MPGHDIIVVGASAGGVEAVSELVRGLPADLPAALFVVHHFPSYSISVLPSILSRAGKLPVEHARHGEKIRPGQIYVSPPNYHLLLARGRVHLVHGPRENGHRPAIDPLFRSAALAYGRRVVGVVLTGTLDDGTSGLAAIKRRGGITVVQDPDDSLYSGMPRSAIENVAVDRVLPLAEIAAELVRLAREPVKVEEGASTSGEMEREIELTELEMDAVDSDSHPGTPASLACPECGGTLWELRDGELIRFRCRVGHAFTADSLLVEQGQALEAALWTALRAIEERLSLSRRLIERAQQRGSELVARRFQEQIRDGERHAETIREVLLSGALPDLSASAEEAAPSHGQGQGRPPLAEDS